jgi:hypothetical protein
VNQLAQFQILEQNLTKALTNEGVSEAEAREQARKEVAKTGAYRTLNGECPVGGANPMACMFCAYGHMTNCHYPLTCEEAECSHYKEACYDDI